MENMKVAQVEYSAHWGDVEDPQSDWYKLANDTLAAFKHSEACEFIVALGEERDNLVHINQYKIEYGMSETFLAYCKQAKIAGFSYICFYS